MVASLWSGSMIASQLPIELDRGHRLEMCERYVTSSVQDTFIRHLRHPQPRNRQIAVSGWATHLVLMRCISSQPSPASNYAAVIRQCGSPVGWAAARERL